MDTGGVMAAGESAFGPGEGTSGRAAHKKDAEASGRERSTGSVDRQTWNSPSFQPRPDGPAVRNRMQPWTANGEEKTVRLDRDPILGQTGGKTVRPKRISGKRIEQHHIEALSPGRWRDQHFDARIRE